MNEYEKRKAQVKKDRCETCLGIGTCDDLEPGDIGGNMWTCEECKGTGIRPAKLGACLAKELTNRD